MNDEARLVSRRSVLRTGLAAGALGTTVGAIPPAAAAAGPARMTPRAGRDRAVVAGFARPVQAVRPKLRWWWPHGLVDVAEIEREVDEMAAAGFGGAEIEDVHHSVEVPMDPAGHGWGTAPWVRAVEAAFARAHRHTMSMDIAVGPSWPAAFPTITPDSDGAAKEIVHGRALVQGGATYSGPVPEPFQAPEDGVTRQTLVAVQALQIDPSSSPTDDRVRLRGETLIDLTGAVKDGRITWTAPDGGQWLLIAYRVRGTGQRPEAGPHTVPRSYVIDHFSRSGAQVLIDTWEKRVLTPRLRRLMRSTGGAMFEDSLEFEATTYWTPDLEEEFRRRKGYSLRDYLPVIVREDEDHVFEYEPETSRRVLNDYWGVLGNLYIDGHVVPVREWAHGLGMQLRVQPYGLRTDAMAAAAALDISEGESLGFNNLDDYRSLAGGRDMGGKQILSNEAAAFAGSAYTVTWDRVLRTLNPIFSAGVNQTVLHGFSYADAPGAKWPGFAAFTPYHGHIGYSESWGPRQPTWRHVADVSDYFGRVQTVLQSGTPKLDVAFLRQKGYAGSGFGAAWFSKEGVDWGWTMEFVAPSLLALPSATVRNGRLDPDGPAFRVLVFEGDAFAGRATVMPLETTRKLVTMARAGLPMVVIGDWSDVGAYSQTDVDDLAEMQRLFDELLSLPTVANVPTREDVPTGLERLGLTPSVRYEAKAPLLVHHRADEKVDYFFFVNTSASETVDQSVSLPRARTGDAPFRMDSWTGKVEPLAAYSAHGDRVSVPLRLAPGSTTIVALGAPGALGGSGPHRGLHVVESTADDIVLRRGRPAIRAVEPGTYTSRLSDGRRIRRDVPALPDTVAIDAWRLKVDEVLPGGSATETRTVTHRLSLSSLRPWLEIPELENASGVGLYRAEVVLDGRWDSGADGAWLDLGEVTDTFRVWLNGKQLPPTDWLRPRFDVGHLSSGRNVLEVEVATTLINRLRVEQPDVYGVARPEAYGLLGPVTLTPYALAEL